MSRGLAAACAVSVMLHGALGCVLLRPRAPGTAVVPTPPELEVEFVDQAAETRGAAAAPVTAPPPAPEPQAALPSGGNTDPVPPPVPPVPPRPAPPGPASPLRVNLAGGEEDRDSLLVTGDNVVPPQADAAFHNRPPAYPAAAARRHAQGTVGLVVHVTEAGVPAWVEVRASSGDDALDEAARNAVALWRFRPATSGGIPVPFDFAYNIRFTLDNGRRVPDGQDRSRLDPGR